MYVPEADDLCLRVLRYKHDHPLSGHFSQNCTLELIRCEYTWPGIHTYVKDYIKSCMACAQAKMPRHQPVMTMPNSGSYPVTPVASQPYSLTPVALANSGHGCTVILPLSTTLGLIPIQSLLHLTIYPALT